MRRHPSSSHPPVGWGIIGATSTVARLAVLPALATSPSARLVAVASRSRPEGVTDHFGAERVHAAYESVLAEPEVEALYVPLPNSMHAEWTLRAAAAGKHVLCEKPLARTGAEAAAMAGACRRAGVVLMEAYMTPFHPRSETVAEMVSSGALGELRSARCAFTGILDRPGDHRWRPETGGGALLDLGIYCLAPLLAVAGRPPRAVAGAARVTPTGVDASFAGWLDFGRGLTGTFECSFEAPERQLLEVSGTEATLVVERAFTPGPDDTRIELRRRDGRARRIDTGGADPYRAMVDHMGSVLRGAVQARRTPADSAQLLSVIDRLRRAARLAEP